MSGALLTALLALGQVPPAEPFPVRPGPPAPKAGPGRGRPPVVEEHVFPSLRGKGEMVLWWNELVLGAVRADRTSPPHATRNLALVHAAVYDAVNAVHRTHAPYLVDARPPAGTSPEAAAAAAAHRVLVALYPRQTGRFDAALTACLVDVPAGRARDEGLRLGRFVADKVLDWRSGDRAAEAGEHSPRAGVGAWRPTAPGFKPALLPAWGKVRPFGIRDPGKFRVPPPPALGSAAYAAAFREVRALGARGSVTRTAEQTEIARFWADDPGTATPPGHWNQIAQDVARARGLTLAESARLFALLNISLADAAIVCWWCKFTFDFWRPIAAIREADANGSPEAPADPGWTPLLTTPPFPAYTSGHSTFSGAAAAVLADFFGTDRVRFEATSEGLPGVRRRFASFSAAAAEAGQSRIYGGIHWQFDNVQGLANGRAVGEHVNRNLLQPRR
jgi:membrane-associated phospholipid phosphatase